MHYHILETVRTFPLFIGSGVIGVRSTGGDFQKLFEWREATASGRLLGPRIVTFLVKAGLMPMEALQAATINPAKFLGESGTLGTIEQGKIASLVLLEANPLEDISNTERIDSVMLNGRFFPKTVLRMMLANVERAANPR